MRTTACLAVGLCFVLSVLSSCNRDKLTGDLDAFEGKYEWVYWEYRANWYSSARSIKLAEDFDYTAAIEFNGKGKVIFYIDNEEVHRTGYRIKDQNTYEDGRVIELLIDPRIEDTQEIDLNNNIRFSLEADTLTCDDFPSESYDQETGKGVHFFVRSN